MIKRIESLIDRLRPGVECAPWVIEELKALRDELTKGQEPVEFQAREIGDGDDWYRVPMGNIENIERIKSSPELDYRYLYARHIVAAPIGWDAEFLVKRLGRVAALAGVTMPEMDYESTVQVAATILGEIARKMERVSAPAVVPDGWKLVPVEPTDAMAVAATKVSLRNPATNGVHQYRAMLSAAPAAPEINGLPYVTLANEGETAAIDAAKGQV